MHNVLKFLTSSERIQSILKGYMLPLGLIALLAGLPLVPEKSLYHRLFYVLICTPAVVLLLLRPKQIIALLREPIFMAFMAFIVWTWLSIYWTHAKESIGSLLKWPLYALALFIALFQIQRHQPKQCFRALYISGLLVLGTTLYALIQTLLTFTPGYRMIGTGALSNPLLSSHLFGFFAVYWIVNTTHSRTSRNMLLQAIAASIMLIAVAATGSRTPFVALSLVTVWLCLLRPNRRHLAFLTSAALITTFILLVLAPANFLQRGLSYRPEIWHKALALIEQAPWIGHGYNSPLAITVDSLGITFSEPHNFALGVLYDLGAAGLAPWLLMQALVLWTGWRHRQDYRFVLVSALMVYGLGAGLTEGGGILSRPKEHWLLIWIPLALMASLSAVERLRQHRITLSLLDEESLTKLCDGATIIEQDGLGPKVLKLADGSFLKIFRRKQWLSSASLDPYGRRFVRNSLALTERHIETPEVLESFRLPDGGTAVRYQPLPGKTLRQALIDAPDIASRRLLVQGAGRFIGQLHEQGVYFRSLHLGNVLLLPSGRMALIDIADMRLFETALSANMRQRNLKHMQRYTQDRHWLFEEQADALMAGYAQAASPKAARDLLLR